MNVKSEYYQSVNNIVDSRMERLHTALPVIVEKYDSDKRTVNAVPAIKVKMGNNTYKQLPVITGVPVAFGGTSKLVIHYPIEKGDTGAVIFFERDVSEWLISGDISKVGSVRMHSLSDGFFIPGIYSEKNIPKSGDGLYIEYEGAKIKISGGEVDINDGALNVS